MKSAQVNNFLNHLKVLIDTVKRDSEQHSQELNNAMIKVANTALFICEKKQLDDELLLEIDEALALTTDSNLYEKSALLRLRSIYELEAKIPEKR